MKNKKTLAIVFSVGIGTFMSSLDSSIVNLAMPLIKSDFGISLSMVEWIVTAYLLIVSSLMLTYGRLSDLYGHKKVYSTGFIIFLAGSLLCGLSFNIEMLIVCRVIQALGAGMLFSTGPAIITESVPPTSRGKALSITAIAVALGLCIGPVIGGTLSTFFGWQSIFFINIPIGLLGIFMVRKNIPKDMNRAYVPFDVAGSFLIFIALFVILLPLSISGDYNIPTALFVSLLAAGVLIIVFFIYYEKKCSYPMLNISLFKNRVFSFSNVAALFTYMAQFIMVFLAPFYLENLRGYSALLSGMLYLPMPLATMCIAPISGYISDRFDSRYISSCGDLIMACGLFMLSFLNINTSIAYTVVSMVITGIGFGMFQTPNNSAIMGNVPPENRGTASGTLATMRNIGMAIGVALSGALFSFYQNKAAKTLAVQGQSGTVLKNSAFTHALHITFIASVIVAFVAMIASLNKGKVKVEK
ncbi:MAG: MFS transporter [Bacillota bacterium]|nr:MFS transporter [Bacillota bacterium]